MSKQEPTINEMKAEAFQYQQEVSHCDEQIAAMQKKRAESQKKLRAITGKIVTAELKGKAQ